MIELCCATGNRAKLREFEQASGGEFAIRGCAPFDCPETGDTFEANARQKALCYSSRTEAEWLFADDSGLVVDALAGEPGIYSARYAGEPGNDRANNDLVLRKLRGVPAAERTARFVCVIALVRAGRMAACFRGCVEGLVLEEPDGAGRFGYDPLFYYPPLGASFGRLSAEDKWRCSHRGNAFRAMLAWMRRAAPRGAAVESGEWRVESGTQERGARGCGG